MATGSIITNNGKKIFLNRTFKSSPDYTAPSQFKVGTGGDTPGLSDTALDQPIPITGTESVDACDATTGWSAGTDSAVSLNTTTFKEGTGSLSLAKSGTSGTTMSASKTTTSRDFTSKDFWCWVYVLDVTDLVASGTALTVRFGSDSSNYYYYDIAIGNLSNGWNYVVFNTSTATGTTGTPTIGACDYTEFIFNTDLAADTIAADRVMVDDIKVASSDDYFGAYTSGYPTLNETTFEAETRSDLLSTEANGYSIDSHALFNTDGTPLMFSESVFTAEGKGNSEELIFIMKDRLED